MDLLNAMRDVCQRKDMRISGMTVGMSLLRNSQRLHKIIETHKDFFLRRHGPLGSFFDPPEMYFRAKKTQNKICSPK